MWQKVKIEGDKLIGRGAHTVVAAGSCVVLYGGSADFQRDIGHCTRYFNDIYIMKTGELIFSLRHDSKYIFCILSFRDLPLLCLKLFTAGNFLAVCCNVRFVISINGILN